MPQRIALYGNCQVWGLAACLQLQCPGLQIEGVAFNDVRSPEEGDALARKLAGYDLVLAQMRERPELGEAAVSRLADTVRAMAPIPRIWFSGFHPDIATTGLKPERPWRFGQHHSTLIAAAFIAGVAHDRVERLFNAYVFARLGFFDEYGRARAFMVQELAAADLDGQAVMTEWERLGVFMHIPVHPTVEALWVLARAVADRHGLGAVDTQVRPPDQLSKFRRWPVYPALARRLGVPGGLDFHPDPERPATLAQFISWSYERYRRHGVDVADLEQVAGAAEILAEEVRPAAPAV